ncbi:MAG: polysaccharide biosynthesis/export protein [Verrucomicrobiota bacterium]|jgi:protein involved in polysaccharide export with SLBB domain
MKIRLLTGAAGMAMLVLFSGCKHTEPHFADFGVGAPKSSAKPLNMVTLTNHIDPTWLQPPTNFFTLGPGDKVEVEILDETNSITSTVIGPDGKLYFNLLPGLDVWGMTIGQTRALMEHELAKFVRDQPHVNITLREIGSKRVWLLGRFQQPGVYPMPAPMTVLEAISMSGGAMTFVGNREITGGPLGEDLADLKHSFILRNGKMLPVDLYRLLNEGDLSQNIYLQPDDFVYFAPAFARQVYVLGAVTQGRPVQYSDGMTLLAAISGAYGTVKDAYLSHVTIIRGSLTQPQATVVNYYDILHGKAPDVALEPHDIVYVPFSPYRYLRRYVEVALNSFVSSVAINAGTKAAGGNVGVSIPVGGGTQTTVPSAPPIGR